MTVLFRVARSLSLVFLVGSVGISVVLGAGLGVAFILNWIVPSIDLGVATLRGLVAIATFVTGLIWTMQAAGVLSFNVDQSEESQDAEDSSLLSEEQIESMADQLTEATMMRMAVRDGWSLSRSKSRR